MEKEDEFLFNFFTHISQMCFDKAKEHVEKEKEPKAPASSWSAFLGFLQQLALAEKSYMDLGFLQNKQKSFLGKDNSLKSIFEYMKADLKKIEEASKTGNNKRLQDYCQNIAQFISARINLIDLYEKIYNLATTDKHIVYKDISNAIESVIQTNQLGFTNICLTPMKTVFTFECEILQHIFSAMHELQRLQFVSTLASLYGAFNKLQIWEGKMQRETWKLGFLMNTPPLPSLYQWLQKLRGAVMSKFSLYFYDNLANQTTPSDMRNRCVKLQIDYYQKMVTFQKKYDADCVILSGNKVDGDIADYDSFPIIVSYPPRSPSQLDTILSMITESNEALSSNKLITKFRSEDQHTYCLAMIEPNIYFVILFKSKKTDKDTFIGNFVNDFCTNLRCTKIFLSLKDAAK